MEAGEVRWLVCAMLLSHCSTGVPSGYRPGAFDAGPMDVTCHIVDWFGQERIVEHVNPRLPSSPVAPCHCGTSEGFAACAFNPGQARFDGTCIGCLPQQCFFAGESSSTGARCDCAPGARAGLVQCQPDGGSVCWCAAQLCPSDAGASIVRFSFCRCSDGLPGYTNCSDGGVSECDCAFNRAVLLDGGR